MSNFLQVETTEIKFRKIQDICYDIFCIKNKEYGTNNIAQYGFEGVMIRLNDKFMRVREDDISEEGLVDALIDISNYACIAHMLYLGQWPKLKTSYKDKIKITFKVLKSIWFKN